MHAIGEHIMIEEYSLRSACSLSHAGLSDMLHAGNGGGWCGYACKALIACWANLIQRPTKYSLQVMDEVVVTHAMYSPDGRHP